MASQYSILRNYGKYVSPYNMDVMMQGMGYMQEKVDTNRQAINEYADYIINSDIAKPQDREYLQNKLNGLIQDVNNVYRKSNLASDGIARAIQSRLGEALDTRTLNAIAGTREFRELSTKLEDMKLNNPKMYSPINEAMALMPYYQWLNDGQVGTRLEPLHYTPYTDYNAEIDSKVKDFLAKYKGQKIQEPVLNEKGERTGEIIETTVDEMPYSKIRSIVSASISQNARAQMQLEGQYMALTNPQMFNQQSTSAFVQKYVSDFDMREKAIKAELAGVGNDSRKKKLLETSLSELRDQRQQMIDEASSFIGQNYSPERAGMFVVQQEFLHGAAMRWSYNNTSVTRKADDFYYKEADRLTTNAKFAWEQKMDMRRLEYDKMRAEAAMIKANGGSGGSGAGGAGQVGGMGVSYTIPYKSDEVMPSEVLQDNIVANARSISNGLISLKNAMGATEVDNINAYISTHPDEFDGLNDDDAFMSFLRNNGGAKYGGLKTRDSQIAYINMMGLMNKRSSMNKVAKDAEDGYMSVLSDSGAAGMAGAVARISPKLPMFGYRGDIVTAEEFDKLYPNGTELIEGGKRLNYDEMALVSSLASRLGNYVTMGVDSPWYSRFAASATGGQVQIFSYKPDPEVDNILMAISNIIGEDLDASSLFNTGYYANIDDVFTDRGNFISKMVKKSKQPNEGGYSWDLSPDMDTVFKDAKERYNTIVDSRYEEFGQKTWAFNSSAPDKSVEKQIYRNMETLFTKAGGLLPKNSAIDNNHVLSPEQDKDGNWWIVGDSGKDDRQRVAVTADDLAGTGYTSYTREREIPSSTYESSISSTTFAPSSAREYGRTVSGLGYGMFATADNAKNYISSYVISGCPEEYKDEMRLISSKIIDGSSNYEVKAKGYQNMDGSSGVEVNIYKAGTGGDPSSQPLSVVDLGDMPYADNVATVMSVAPQVYLAMALEEAMRKEIDRINMDFGRNDVNEDLANLMSPVQDDIRKALGAGGNANGQK